MIRDFTLNYDCRTTHYTSNPGHILHYSSVTAVVSLLTEAVGVLSFTCVMFSVRSYVMSVSGNL